MRERQCETDPRLLDPDQERWREFVRKAFKRILNPVARITVSAEVKRERHEGGEEKRIGRAAREGGEERG